MHRDGSIGNQMLHATHNKMDDLPEYVDVSETLEDYEMLQKLLSKQLDLTRYSPHMDITFVIATEDLDVRIRKRPNVSVWKKWWRKWF